MITLFTKKKFQLNKKLLLFILLGGMVAFPLTCLSQQNLVLNGDLEDYSYCPSGSSEIYSAIGWWNFTFTGTPDYLNTCSNSTVSGIPSELGYQYPKSGEGMIHNINIVGNPPGVFAIDSLYPHIARWEAFGGSFTQPLEAGIYTFSCFVNYADYGSYQSDSTSEEGRVATNAFDLILLKDTVKIWRPVLPYTLEFNIIPLNGDFILEDTLNWVELKVCFQTKGGERFFAISAFRDTSEIQLSFTGYNQFYLGLYYFDDFSVEACPSCCEGQFEIFENITISNNPSSQIEFTPHFLAGSYAYLYIYDSAGRLVEKQHLSDKTPLFFGKNRAEGMYHFRYETGNGNVQFGKIIVNQP